MFALGLFLNGFPTFDLSTIRIMGVLQRIAICYFFASVIFFDIEFKGASVLVCGFAFRLLGLDGICSSSGDWCGIV